MSFFEIRPVLRIETGVAGYDVGGGYGTYTPTYTPSSSTPVYAQPQQAAASTPSVSAQTMSGYTVQYQPAVINSLVNNAIAQKTPLNDLMVPVGGIFDSRNNSVSAMDLPVDENGMVRLDDLVRASPEVGSSIATTLPNTADSINAMLSRPATAAPAAGVAAPAAAVTPAERQMIRTAATTPEGLPRSVASGIADRQMIQTAATTPEGLPRSVVGDISNRQMIQSASTTPEGLPRSTVSDISNQQVANQEASNFLGRLNQAFEPAGTPSALKPSESVVPTQNISTQGVVPPAPSPTDFVPGGVGEPPEVVTSEGTFTQEQLSKQGFEPPKTETATIPDTTAATTLTDKTGAADYQEPQDKAANDYKIRLRNAGIRESTDLEKVSSRISYQRLNLQNEALNPNTTPERRAQIQRELEELNYLNTNFNVYEDSVRTDFKTQMDKKITDLRAERALLGKKLTRPDDLALVQADYDTAIANLERQSADDNISQTTINNADTTISNLRNWQQTYQNRIMEERFFVRRYFGDRTEYNGANIAMAASAGLSFLGVVAGVVQQQQQYKLGLRQLEDERKFREQMLNAQMAARGGGGGGGGGSGGGGGYTPIGAGTTVRL